MFKNHEKQYLNKTKKINKSKYLLKKQIKGIGGG